jgi:hypothetical protein
LRVDASQVVLGDLPKAEPRNGTGISASQPGKSYRSFARDQRFQRLTQQSWTLVDTGQLLSFFEEIVVEGNGRAHAKPPPACIKIRII